MSIGPEWFKTIPFRAPTTGRHSPCRPLYHRQNSEFLQTLDFPLHSRIQRTSSKLYLHRSDRLLGDHDNDAFIANFDRQ